MTRAPVSADRRAMIAKAHVAKKALGLDDDTYRDVLEQTTGHRSAASCSDGQLSAVLARFKALGWDGPPEGTGKRRSAKSWVRMVWAIWGDLKPLLDNADDAALRGFVAKQTCTVKNPAGISDPEFLSPAEANKIIGGLKGWLDRMRAKGGNNVGA